MWVSRWAKNRNYRISFESEDNRVHVMCLEPHPEGTAQMGFACHLDIENTGWNRHTKYTREYLAWWFVAQVKFLIKRPAHKLNSAPERQNDEERY
jgi:hypothetical protein